MDVDKTQPSVDQKPEDNEHQMDGAETSPAGANLNEIPLDDSTHDVDDETLPRNSTRVNEVLPDHPIHQGDVDCARQQTRRSTRSPKYSERYIQWQQSLAKEAILSSMSAEVKNTNTQLLEPSSYLEAISCADSKFWIPAIFEEYDSLVQNGTWTLCPLPQDRKAIQDKWVMNSSLDSRLQLLDIKPDSSSKGTRKCWDWTTSRPTHP